MGRHRWLPAAARDGAASRLKRTPRFRIALGAAFVVAGLCLGYGIVSIATADLTRSSAPVVDGIPLRSGPSSGPGTREGAGGGGDSAAASDGGGPALPPDGGDVTNSGGGADADADGGIGGGDDGGGDAGAPIIVHVAGAVASPGIVRLGAGARVFEAIEAAGGARKEAQLEALNLAAPLTDGQQVYVPTPDDAGPPAPGSGTGGGTGGPGSGGGAAGGGAAGDPVGKININTASAEELAELPRVGPVLAGRIVEFREQHGPYGQPSDLDAVPGIGPVMLEALVELVTV